MFDERVESIYFDGPGRIDLHLDEYLNSQELCSDFVKLLDMVDDELSKHQNPYPKAKLNELLQIAKINLDNDYKIESLLLYSVSKKELLNEH